MCRAQTFNRDLGSLFNNIFTQLGKCTYPSVRDPKRLCELFKESFLEVFNREYLTVEDLKEISARNRLAPKPRQASKRAIDKVIDESLNKLPKDFARNTNKRVRQTTTKKKQHQQSTLDRYFY